MESKKDFVHKVGIVLTEETKTQEIANLKSQLIILKSQGAPWCGKIAS